MGDSFFYKFFVKGNNRVRYEYERYVQEHIEEHYTNRFKHIKLLLRLNYEYRIKHRKSPCIYWDVPYEEEMPGCESIVPIDPFISVIVASYNYSQFLEEALNSIYSQTYKNFEVIVIDDGSTDGSLGVLRNYKRIHPEMRVFQHDKGINKGLPETVLLGLKMAKGEYIAFCEADDLWKKDYLEKKVNIINSYSDAKVIVNNVHPFGDEKLVSAAMGVSLEFTQTFKNTINCVNPLLIRERNVIPSFSCCMVEKKELEKCDFLSVPRKSNLDWWLWRQILYTNKLYALQDKLTEWRRHPDSYLSSESYDEAVKINLFKDKMDELLINKYPSIDSEINKIYSITKLNVSLIKNNSKMDCPSFSIVMPTYNRKELIGKAIDSVLNQSFKNYELIISDDNSNDGTEAYIRNNYKKYIEEGKIKYIKNKKIGVSACRNAALVLAQNRWIAFLDSDNVWMPDFLETFAKYIISYPDKLSFYARVIMMSSGSCRGRHFNYDLLLEQNYIDMGAYVHDRCLIDKAGMFDSNMTRLVDWDYITRQSSVSEPYFIDRAVFLYNDNKSTDRISDCINLSDNMNIFRKKNCSGYPTITTLITSYNHEKYIETAIKSALMQKGKFIHEILISDDGSNDGTKKIIKKYAKKYPNVIKDISLKKNYGISHNLKRGFEYATGKYLAILEGDDYWICEWKLNRQMKFLDTHPECNMVFSRIKLFNENDGSFQLLQRQNKLPSVIDGTAVLKCECQNPVANFSSSFFRTDVMKMLPNSLYKDRFNEIVLAMYLTKSGKIGYVSDVMSVYRVNDNGTWSGKSEIEKIESALKNRKWAKEICDKKYYDLLDAIIQDLEDKLKVARNT